MDSAILEDLSMVLSGPLNMTRTYLGMVWSERFWLRKGVSWTDLTNNNSVIRYPQAWELQIGLLFTILLILLRAFMDKYIFHPFALTCGLKMARKAEPKPALERFYDLDMNPSIAELKNLSKHVGWTSLRTRRWFRTKRRERQCKIRKFSECAWRAFKYTVTFLYGLYVLSDEEWALDAKESIGFRTWPHHHVKTEFFIYYMVELGYYTSVLLSLFSDVYRSDFLEQAVHHVATVILLSFSWVANFIRIGLIVLTVHNAADIWLQGTKMCGYLNKMNWVPFFMTMFVGVWTCTRCYLYPVHVLKPTLEESYKMWDSMWASALVMVGCLVLLQLLHVVWTYYVVICLARAYKRGSFKDERSDDEESSGSTEKED